MKNSILKTCMSLALASAALNAVADDDAIVSNGNNDGPGSLRAALTSGSSSIKIMQSVTTIAISETLVYNQSAPLEINGAGQTIDGSALTGNANIFTVSSGANLDISNIAFTGNSNTVNEDPANPVGGKGIYVNVPTTRTGAVYVNLNKVSVTRVGNHGVHVSDCTLGDACGGGSGGAGDGSPASIFVNATDVLISNVGFGKQDADGLRVDDRGEGSIYFTASDSTFINVGADGVELDEGNDGDVTTLVRNSLFDGNGEYCNLIPFLAGGSCDDGGNPDTDDGFDIDEAGAGSLYAEVIDTKIINNFDEGLDLDEEGEGDVEAEFTGVRAASNEDEGVKVLEEDAGDSKVVMQAVTAADNNGSKEGIGLEENADGDLQIVVTDTNIIGGDDEKIRASQGGEGSGTIKVRQSTIGALLLDNVDEI